MSRTWKDMPQWKWKDKKTGLWIERWNGSKIGKWHKRRYHKAFRSWKRGTGGKERSVLKWAGECKWKGW